MTQPAREDPERDWERDLLLGTTQTPPLPNDDGLAGDREPHTPLPAAPAAGANPPE